MADVEIHHAGTHVPLRRLRVDPLERARELLLDAEGHRVANGTQLLVELVLELVQLDVITMESKDAVEDHALMRRESVRRLEPVEREGRAATEQSEQFGILLLLDAHVSTDREIDERGGD